MHRKRTEVCGELKESSGELKAVVKTGALKVLEADPSYPSLLRPICCDKRVKQPALTHTPSPPRERERKVATKVNFLNYSDHS